MKGNIRNSKLVSLETTKLACEIAKSIRVRSTKNHLYDQGKYLTLSQIKKGSPPPKFERMEISPGVIAWSPMNVSGREYFNSLSEEEKYEFMFHPPPEAKPRPCESKRVVDGRAIKPAPRGFREADLFPGDRAVRKTKIRSADEFSSAAPSSLSEEDVAHICKLITNSSVQ